MSDVAEKLWTVACILVDVAESRRQISPDELFVARLAVLDAKWRLEELEGVRVAIDGIPRSFA